VWRGGQGEVAATGPTDYDDQHLLIKKELMPDGRTKLILKEKVGGKVVERIG